MADNIGLFPDGFSFASTLTILTITQVIPTIFIPIKYKQRVGLSKISPLKDFFIIMRLIFRLGILFNPHKLLVPFGYLLLIAAFLRSIRNVLLNNYLGQLSVILFIFAIQIFIFAVLIDALNKKLNG